MRGSAILRPRRPSKSTSRAVNDGTADPPVGTDHGDAALVAGRRGECSGESAVRAGVAVAAGHGERAGSDRAVVRVAPRAVVALEHRRQAERGDSHRATDGIEPASPGCWREVVVDLRRDDVVADDEVLVRVTGLGVGVGTGVGGGVGGAVGDAVGGRGGRVGASAAARRSAPRRRAGPAPIERRRPCPRRSREPVRRPRLGRSRVERRADGSHR